jgi:hypothetical protein
MGFQQDYYSDELIQRDHAGVSRAMFEKALLLGETERKILLATRDGNDTIDNYVEVHPPPPHSCQQYQELVRLFGGNWKERKPPTGYYNCAGHVWANRRTTILCPNLMRRFLDEDGYRRLTEQQLIWPGDVAVYVDLDASDEILHVGRVYRLKEGFTPASRPMPWVISKWNSTSGESLHQAYDVPYSKEYHFEVRFYTDRPQ